MGYFINFLKNVKFNFAHNVFGCPKVACSRDGARDLFCYSPVNNALSSSRHDASLISSISRDTLSGNETHKKENFDDWCMYNNTSFSVSDGIENLS